jgi:aryl-alcohol dehydrogenase-like predicted oxidoreductase
VILAVNRDWCSFVLSAAAAGFFSFCCFFDILSILQTTTTKEGESNTTTMASESTAIAPQGFGCMGFSAFYGSAQKTTVESATAVIAHAVDNGVTLLNSANFYGPLNEVGYGANLRLLREVVASVGRDKVQLMVKICMDTRCPVEATGSSWVNKGDGATVRADVEYALATLGVDCLDVAVVCRVPQDVPIEDTVRALAALVADGKVKHIGLSEASAAVIRRAHAVAPIYCVEQEWSLWSRDIEAEIVPTCKELGIKVVAYSPLGRGFLTGALRSRDDPAFGAHDFRLMSPRFADGALEANLAAVDAVAALASGKGCTVGQLALAFLHHQGDWCIPIPGTTSVAHLDENLAARSLVLSAEDLAAIDAIFPPSGAAVQGDRYPHMTSTFHGNNNPGL